MHQREQCQQMPRLRFLQLVQGQNRNHWASITMLVHTIALLKGLTEIILAPSRWQSIDPPRSPNREKCYHCPLSPLHQPIFAWIYLARPPSRGCITTHSGGLHHQLKFLIALLQLVFPVDTWAQSGKEGTLRSSDRELDAAKRGAHNSASHNIRGEHSCVV
jgi:hypothetical protein